MDKATTDESKKIDGVDTPNESKLRFRVRLSSEMAKELPKLLSEMDKSFEEHVLTLKKQSKSFWSDKKYLALLKKISEVAYENTRGAYIENMGMQYIETRLSIIEEIVQGMTEKVKIDLSDLKSQVEALRKTISEPAFTEVAQFVQSVKTTLEKSKQSGKDYVK